MYDSKEGNEKIEKFNVSLNVANVKKARELQLILSGAKNISGLLDDLLAEWIIKEESWIEIRKKQEGKKS